MNRNRRHFLSSSLACTAAAALPYSARSIAATESEFGESSIIVLSDGNLSLPPEMILPSSINEAEKSEFLNSRNINVSRFEPDCNVTLWQIDDRLILFDVGAGSNFMPSAGKVLEDLETQGIDPTNVTDVVFTHAHPDHLWGLIDDFDELTFPNAAYYMNAIEWDYWQDEYTIDTLPEVRKTFAIGARNRFAYIEDQINLFGYGDEVLPGIEALDTHGHTPGHTSFALHQGSNSVVVLGDAITHHIISFEKAHWPSGSDQDQEAGKATRLSLLDRMEQDKMRILGFHLPHPGLGFVERAGSAYRYVAS